jgi:hypothetical protein
VLLEPQPLREAATQRVARGWSRPALGRPIAVALALVALVAVVPAIRALRGGEPPSSGVASSGVAHVARAEQGGTLRLDGARVDYRAGASLRSDGGRRVDLDDGEVDVEVTPGGPGRFRVYAPRFIVEVIGTRFVVRTDGVRTLHGRVRVLDLSEREIAVVSAGQSWSAPPPATAAPGPAATSPAAIEKPAPLAPAPPPIAPHAITSTGEARPDSQKVAHRMDRIARVARSEEAIDREPATAVAPAAAPVVAEPTPDALLKAAQSDLAHGDVLKAREKLDEARAVARSPRLRAAIDLLGADALLVEKHRPEAMDAYRHAADAWADSPEGEMAAFALAELLCESGSPADARAALTRYLARYPSGRFTREAADRLRSLPTFAE